MNEKDMTELLQRATRDLTPDVQVLVEGGLRRGQARQRRRRTAAAVVSSAAAVLVAVGGFQLLSADGTTSTGIAPADPAPPSASTRSTRPAEPSESTTTSASPEPRLLAYAGGESPGVQVHDRADVRKLTGAPADFKQFIARTAEKLVKGSTCDDAAVGVTVQTLRTDGYAVGGVNDCGGYAAMWAVVDGQWQEIQGTQDTWECRILKRYRVPSDVAGTSCYDYKTGKAHPYSQA